MNARTSLLRSSALSGSWICYNSRHMDLFHYTIADTKTTLPADVVERYRKSLEDQVATAARQAWNRQQTEQDKAARDAKAQAETEEAEAKRLFRERSGS